MKLEYLQLCNFRQFYGETPKIIFAHGKRNVTVIHGCNGAGKTALLNAFTWCLYGSFSRGFSLKDQLVNKRAIREAGPGVRVEAWVELGLEHDDVRYRIRRQAEAVGENGEEDVTSRSLDPTIEFAGPDGQWKSGREFSETVGRILPEDLHTYFFFDGERIERIVQPDQSERRDINNAAKTLLGIGILSRAQTHMRNARKELEGELKSIGDADTKRLLEEKEALEAIIEEMLATRSALLKNIEGFQEAEKAISAQLLKHNETKGLQAQREKLNGEKTAVEKRRERIAKELALLLSKKAYTVFLEKGISQFEQLTGDLHARGEIPAGMKRHFVQDLLDKKECICKRELGEGTPARRAVEDWKRRSGLADVEETAIRMEAEVGSLRQKASDFWQQLDRLQTEKENTRRSLADIAAKLADINEKLKGSPKEEIRKLEERLETVQNNIKAALENKGRTEAGIEVKKSQIEKLQRAIKDHQAKEAKQVVAQRRVAAAEDAIARLTETQDLMGVQFRQSLQERILKLFQMISYTPYVPAIDVDYSVRLLESAGGAPLPVAASQGENLILSLSFIGSIIELTREHQKEHGALLGPDASTLPLVMDSPFGSLDPTYGERIAQHLPAMADQVVVMVQKKQWLGEVEQALSPKLGATYVLTYFSPRDDIGPETVPIGDKSYDLVLPSANDYEYTEILKVNHG
jgi:DNA sulfur modification protein DndD